MVAPDNFSVLGEQVGRQPKIIDRLRATARGIAKDHKFADSRERLVFSCRGGLGTELRPKLLFRQAAQALFKSLQLPSLTVLAFDRIVL